MCDLWAVNIISYVVMYVIMCEAMWVIFHEECHATCYVVVDILVCSAMHVIV